MKKINKIEIKHRVGGKIDYKSDTYTVKLKRIFFYISLVTSALFAPLIYMWLNSIEKINNVLLLPFYLTILYFVVAFILIYLLFFVILKLFQKSDIVFTKPYYIYDCQENDIINKLNCNYIYEDYLYNVFVTKQKSKKVNLIAISKKKMPDLDNLLPTLKDDFNIKEFGFDALHIEASLLIYSTSNISQEDVESLMEVKTLNTIYAIYDSNDKKMYIQRYKGKDLDMMYATEYEEMLDYIYEQLLKEDSK